jgi:serine protease Do
LEKENMMKKLGLHRNGLVATALVVCLAGAAVGLAQRQADVAAPVVAHDETALSSVFRNVSKDVLPSIVSIETRGKAAQLTSGRPPLDDEDGAFKEFFESDPRLKEFFKRMPQGQRGLPDQQPRRSPGSRGMGSGFIIDGSGVILTNTHVVRDAEEVKVRLQDGREFIATDVKTDPRTDVAIVRIEGAGKLVPLPMGNSDTVEIGDWVLAVGSPFGFDLSVTHGIISAKGRGMGIAEREDFLQTDAPINPGNSGGPLVNLRGEVIGVNTAISTRSGGSQGIGFTIPINMAKWVSDQLMQNGEVKRAYLGVSIQPVDPVLAKKFEVEAGRGVLINQVVPGSPASDARLKEGDVVLSLNEKPIDSPRTLQGAVEQLAVGKSYPLEVVRDGQKMTLQVEAREMPKDYSRSKFSQGPVEEESPSQQDSRDETLGLDVRELNAETAKELGVSDTKGVVVTKVAPESPAANIGVQKGDVILEINRTKIATMDDFTQAMKSANVKDGVVMLVKSDRGTRYLSVQVR